MALGAAHLNDSEGNVMSMLGMNVEAVRGLARSLRAQAAVLQGLLKRVDGVVNAIEIEWKGADAQSFVNDWRQNLRPRLVDLVEHLEGLARAADQNADEQDRASGGSGGGSHGGGFAGGGGGGGGGGGWGDEGDFATPPDFPQHPRGGGRSDSPFPEGIDPGMDVPRSPGGDLPGREPIFGAHPDLPPIDPGRVAPLPEQGQPGLNLPPNFVEFGNGSPAL